MMKLAKYKLIVNRFKVTFKKKNSNKQNKGGLVLGLGGGICNYDVAKEHSDYLVSIAGNPVKSFSILTGRDSRYWNSQEAWIKFYKKELINKNNQIREQKTQYDRIDAEFSNTRQRLHVLEEINEGLVVRNETLRQSVVEGENGLLRSTRKVVHYKIENHRLKKELNFYITGDQKLKQELLISAQEGARLGGEDALKSNPILGAGFSQEYSTNIADISLAFWRNTWKNFDVNVVQHRVVNDISRTMTRAMFNYGRTQYGIGTPKAGVDKDARFRTMLDTLNLLLKNEQHEIYYKQVSRAIGTALYNTVDLIINNSGL